MFASSGNDVAQKLAGKFPSGSGYALGALLDADALNQLDAPTTIVSKDTSVVVMKSFSGDATKLHYLHVRGTTYDLGNYLGISGAPAMRLVVADSQEEGTQTAMSIKDISAWNGATPIFVSTQGFAFGTTAKTVGRVAELTGVATAAARTIDSLPLDVGVYDASTFEGSSPSNTQSYHVSMVRFYSGDERELPQLVQFPYSLAANDVKASGFLVPLAAPPATSALADKWLGQAGALAKLSGTANTPFSGFALNDVFGGLGAGSASYHQAKAVFVLVDLSLAPSSGSYRLKDITSSTFSAPVTHTQLQGFAAPSQANSVLLDASFANGQPKLFQLPILAPAIGGAVTIDGLFINTNAEASAVASAANTVIGQNPWAVAVANAGAMWSNVLVTQHGIFYPYKVTPTGLGAPLPMLLKLSGTQLSWTPTIANNFARYEVRQSSYFPTSANDGTIVSTITDMQTTTATIDSSATGYFAVWAFNDQGNAPSTPVYIQPAPTVGLTSVTYCSSNIRQCLHSTWSQFSGSGFEKYELYRRGNSADWSLAQTFTSASTTAADDNGLTCGTTYDYKVVVYANGKSGTSNVMSGNPNNGFGFCNQPSSTLNYVVYCSSNIKTCLHVGWSGYNGEGFESYEIQRSPGSSGSGPWQSVATITNAGQTDVNDNGLTCGSTYSYKVVLHVAGGAADSNVMFGNPNNGYGACW